MNHLSVLILVLAGVALGLALLCLYFLLRSRKDENPPLSADLSPASYQTAAIDQFLYDRCCRYMTEHRPFLVDSFNLQDLSNALYTNKTYLSKTINRYSGKNFRQYVNYYRVMYAMELFRANMGLRILDMALLSGFDSQTSFLQSFKQVMGEKPSHWCDRIRKKYMTTH